MLFRSSRRSDLRADGNGRCVVAAGVRGAIRSVFAGRAAIERLGGIRQERRSAHAGAHRLAVALHSIGTIRSGFHVFPGTFHRVASGQDQDRAANRKNFQKLFHSFSPTVRADLPSILVSVLRQQPAATIVPRHRRHASRSVRNDRQAGDNRGLDLGPGFSFKRNRPRSSRGSLTGKRC